MEYAGYEDLDSERWVRLATAAVNARDDLRDLIPDLDSALLRPSDNHAELLRRLRVLAERHADKLRLGLKHPA